MKRRIPVTIVAVAAVAAVLLVAMAVGAVPATGAGGDDTTTSRAYLHSYNLPSSGVALEGYCPVAYFAVDKPVRGKPEYASTYNQVTYYLASADAKAEFDRNPAKYIPAFGGWCAFGMSVQDKFPVDPTNFKIVDDRLMVFLRNANIDAQELWNQGDQPQLIRKAEDHWRTVRE